MKSTFIVVLAMLMTACGELSLHKADTRSVSETATQVSTSATANVPFSTVALVPARTQIYAPFTLTADLSHLSDNQKKALKKLINAGKIADQIFWQQAYGDKQALLNSISDPQQRRFAELNYGPWDRLESDKPFVFGFTDKPLGANSYPADMTKDEFEQATFDDKRGLYSIVRRNENGKLYSVPYSKAFASEIQTMSKLLREAAALVENKAFAHYLTLRADALLSDQYQASDMAWMDMNDNLIDVVIGPIEVYEDKLFNYRAAFSTYVLLKDTKWSAKLEKFASYLPQLQKGLPVPEQYKAEVPGANAQLNAYDVLFYAGDSNSGSKTIAINLPNDEEVQLKKGTRRLQLKNAMQAKFEKIMLPITDMLIAQDQRKHVTFNAFFSNTMFHEVAHGLGIKNTINGNGTVRQALKEASSALEEGKADILGLFMITSLLEKGVIKEGVMEDYYTTFLAGIFRSTRFGASSAHGKANMVRFNFFRERGAFSRDEKTGHYRVDYPKMRVAMNELSEVLLTLQGDGDYDGAVKLLSEGGLISVQLQADLDKLALADIPVDIYFEQGAEVLKL